MWPYFVFSVIVGFKWLWIGSFSKYPVNAGVSQGSTLGPTIFLLHINDLSDDVICTVETYADDTTLYP